MNIATSTPGVGLIIAQGYFLGYAFKLCEWRDLGFFYAAALFCAAITAGLAIILGGERVSRIYQG